MGNPRKRFPEDYSALSPETYEVADVIGSYVYRQGILGAQYRHDGHRIIHVGYFLYDPLLDQLVKPESIRYEFVLGGGVLKKASLGSRAFDVFNVVIMLFILIVVLYPILNIIATSLSGTRYISSGA